MTFSSRSVLLRAALLAFAAGCASTVERDRAVGSPSSEDAASSSGSGRDGAGAGVVGDGDGGDGDGDGGAGGDEDGDGGGGGDGPAPSTVCPSSGFSGSAADAIAVTWSDDAASLVLRDGSLVALELPPSAPPPRVSGRDRGAAESAVKRCAGPDSSERFRPLPKSPYYRSSGSRLGRRRHISSSRSSV